MYNHQTPAYTCPFCLLLKDIRNEHVYSVEDDIFYKNKVITAFVASHQNIRNPGTVLIIPNIHIENLYDMPDDLLAAVHTASRDISIAMREAYPCEGNVLRQHNEPIEGAKCKGQDVLHYHLQIIPRYPDDQMYEYAESTQRRLVPPAERAGYAARLRKVLKS
jgi:histidine triad (HIT) family protein